MIYLDYAATTPVTPQVVHAMLPYYTDIFGNPSSIHTYGREARAAMETARQAVADMVGAKPSEMTFTSGGTESIQSALLGAVLANPHRRHIVTSNVEHHALLHTCAWLHDVFGVRVTHVPARGGVVDVEEVVHAVQEDTCLVSIMAVNNETGAIMPVSEIARAVKQKAPDVLVHTDAVQALGSLSVSVHAWNVDLASFSAHKIHGPKGVGGLYIRSGVPWKPILRGGTQEKDRRAGTENVAGIVGFGEAVRTLSCSFSQHVAHLAACKARFISRVTTACRVHVNVEEHACASHIVNLWFPGVKNDRLLMRMDLAGVAASAGSACTAGSLEPSHVLIASGYEEQRVRESIRFSFSSLTTMDEIDEAARIVIDCAHQLSR